MKFTIAAFILIISLNALGQTIPSDIKKIVNFIYADSAKKVPLGTGFFVGIRDTLSNSKEIYTYLVTAKHVLKQNGIFLNKIFVRINRKDSLSEIGELRINTNGSEKNVYMHSDSTVDIAVLPVNIDSKIFDFKVITNDFLTNRKSFKTLGIKEGSDVFFTGMFTPFLGDKKNYPIVRFGRVALVTEEKIKWDNEMTELYLVESTTYGGNSGSPVFFYLGIDRGDGSIQLGSPEIKLAGIMKGYFGESIPISIVETKKIPVSQINLGIAAVVPSYYLQEILYCKELVNQRK